MPKSKRDKDDFREKATGPNKCRICKSRTWNRWACSECLARLEDEGKITFHCLGYFVLPE